MNRRNFVKGLLAIGAGFSILPPATTYARIWQVEKKVLLPEQAGIGYIWNHYYMAWSKGSQIPTDPWLPETSKWGDVHNRNGQLWYRYSGGWVPLEKKRRPTNFKPKEIHPTVYLGSHNGNVDMLNCWTGPGYFAEHIMEEPCGAEGYVNGVFDGPNYIPNIVMETQPNGEIKYYDVGPVRETDTVSELPATKWHTRG